MKVKTKGKMIPGYRFIERQSPEHEPNIVGTRLTVTHVAGLLYYAKGSIEELINNWEGRLSKEMVDEAIAYYESNKAEIDGYIAESRSKSGMILKGGKVIRKPDGA